MAQKGKRSLDNALLLALACGATVEQAALQTKMSPRTVYRRLDEQAFCQRLQALLSDMVQRTMRMLTAAGMESVKTLLALQQSPTPAAVRLGAAKAVLEIGRDLRATVDLEQRLAAVESQLAGLACPPDLG
jgi:hypothetical protein